MRMSLRFLDLSLVKAEPHPHSYILKPASVIRSWLGYLKARTAFWNARTTKYNSAAFEIIDTLKIKKKALSEEPTSAANKNFESQSIKKLDGVESRNVPSPAMAEFPRS
jgi:hypothetical protein